MNKSLSALVVTLLIAACGPSGDGQMQAQDEAANTAPAAAKPAPSDAGALTLETDEQKYSYALGMDIGRSLEGLPVALQLDYLTAGLRAKLGAGEPLLADEEARTVLQSFMQDLQKARQQESTELAAKNQAEGERFLAENKTKDGVKVTDSGLQYIVLEPGDGPVPGPQDRVKVHYEGRLIDGTVFDSSIERGEPVTFPVDAVIPGWTEALQIMHEGAKLTLFIPPELAYGQRGAGADIGPGETLIFDVELIEVIEPATEAAQAPAEPAE